MRSHPLFVAYLAFASVCFFWGTTYLGIRIALESWPPMYLVAVRFMISGGLLIAALKLKGVAFPSWRTTFMTGMCGVLVLGVGNSCLTFAETMIPSSLAALFIAVSPVWMVTLEALVPGGERLTAGTIIGIAVAILGAGLLVGPDAFQQGFSGNIIKGFLLLQFGSISWGLGSILQRRFKEPAHPVASASVQQFAAGLFFLPALFLDPRPVLWTATGVGSLLYLVFFGSIVGYTSYIIVLQRLPVSIVTLHTYINPVVAAVLGYLAYAEPFGRRELAAMAVIFAGVAIVKKFGHKG